MVILCSLGALAALWIGLCLCEAGSRIEYVARLSKEDDLWRPPPSERGRS